MKGLASKVQILYSKILWRLRQHKNIMCRFVYQLYINIHILYKQQDPKRLGNVLLVQNWLFLLFKEPIVWSFVQFEALFCTTRFQILG